MNTHRTLADHWASVPRYPLSIQSVATHTDKTIAAIERRLDVLRFAIAEHVIRGDIDAARATALEYAATRDARQTSEELIAAASV